MFCNIKKFFIECRYLFNRILFPPAKVMFVIWTISWIYGIEQLNEIYPLYFIIFGYIFYCGLANCIYRIFRTKYDNYQQKIEERHLEELRLLPPKDNRSFIKEMLDFFKMDNFEENNYNDTFIEETEVIITTPITETIEILSRETTDSEPHILESFSHTLEEPQIETIINNEEAALYTENIVEINNISLSAELEEVSLIEESFPISKEIIVEGEKIVESQIETTNNNQNEIPSIENIIEPDNTTQIDVNEEITPIKESLPIPEEYLSQRMVITGVHLQFITIARDIVNHNSVDELRTKLSYNISSEDYDTILQELIDAKIIDTNHNVLMTSDVLEHFIDIYEPNLFHCPHGTFDKDIFICLGEILLQHDIDYAKSCFSSIDELKDYLDIMGELKLLEFKNGSYNITYSEEEFFSVCKGVPEYYNNSKTVLPQSSNISRINYDSLDGSEFEQYCADILLQNNYKNVTLTKASGDHGIDILAEKDDITYAIQCKCYSSNIGNAAIQQAFTGKKLYRRDIAVVLTNQYFTQQAQEEASSLGVKLWDRDKLNQMIEKIHK